jgi:hypothetical protein
MIPAVSALFYKPISSSLVATQDRLDVWIDTQPESPFFFSFSFEKESLVQGNTCLYLLPVISLSFPCIVNKTEEHVEIVLIDVVFTTGGTPP